MIKFTQEEIIILKQLAQEQIKFREMFTKDKDGEQIPYRNRYSKNPPHLDAQHNTEVKR